MPDNGSIEAGHGNAPAYRGFVPQGPATRVDGLATKS